VKPEYAVALSQMIPQARLMIVPGGHGDYMGEISADPKQSPAWVAGWLRNSLTTRDADVFGRHSLYCRHGKESGKCKGFDTAV